MVNSVCVMYPVAEIHRQNGLLPLLQEEDDHQREGVGRNPALSLAVHMTQLHTHNYQYFQMFTHVHA